LTSAFPVNFFIFVLYWLQQPTYLPTYLPHRT